jgi:hypothetical protein
MKVVGQVVIYNDFQDLVAEFIMVVDISTTHRYVSSCSRHVYGKNERW